MPSRSEDAEAAPDLIVLDTNPIVAAGPLLEQAALVEMCARAKQSGISIAVPNLVIAEASRVVARELLKGIKTAHIVARLFPEDIRWAAPRLGEQDFLARAKEMIAHRLRELHVKAFDETRYTSLSDILSLSAENELPFSADQSGEGQKGFHDAVIVSATFNSLVKSDSDDLGLSLRMPKHFRQSVYSRAGTLSSPRRTARSTKYFRHYAALKRMLLQNV